MKNKKGFTIVELLSVIVILGIIITIGIFSVSSIRKTILDKQYKNVKAEIELAAEKYYADTESNEVYVETLISEGYLKADNKSMIITDPRDGTSLNCFLVTIDENEDASLKEEDRSVDGKCIDASTSNRSIKIVTSDESEISDGWYKAPIILKAKLTKEGTYSFIWKSDLNPNTLAENITYDLNELYTERGNVIDDVFYVTATGENETLEAIGKRVRIDGVVPNIKSLEIPDKDKWTKTKTLKANVTDIGSGIDGYILSEENCENIDLKDYHKIGDVPNPNDVKIEYEITKNGTYSFCISDKAGNIKKYEEDVVIDRIDDIPPECDYIDREKEEGWNKKSEIEKWVRNNVTVSFGCKDNESGCAKLTYKSKMAACNGNSCYQNYTYTHSYKNAPISSTIGSFKIEDNVGNITTCPSTKKELIIYLDKDNPVISNVNISSTKSGYNSRYTKVSFTLEDKHSGVSSFCIGPAKNNCSSKNINIYCTKNGSKYNCSVDYTFTSRDGSGNNEYVYITAYDNAGNSSIQSKGYKLYKSCTNTRFNGYGSCSRKCGGGYKNEYRTDEYLGTNCDGYGNVSCNTMSCCSSTYKEYYSTGSCDESCGWGSQRVTYKEYSNYDDSYCGKSYSYNDCYEDYGCSVPDPDPEPTPDPGGNCDTINGNRCDKSTDTLYWISDCCNGVCNYAARAGNVEYGTISRSRLSGAANCSSYGPGGGGGGGTTTKCYYVNVGCAGNGQDTGTTNCTCGYGYGGYTCGCKCPRGCVE